MRSLIPRVRKPAPEETPEPDLKPRRDPAPSRLLYRYQRLMLTPLFRTGLRVGLPAFLAVFVGMTWFSSEANRAALTERIESVKASIQHRPEFMVNALEITGASPVLAGAITRAMELNLPQSSFALDLTDLRARITALTAVQTVILRVRPGGTLEVGVTAREPVAIWRHSDGLRLLDAEGVMVSMIETRSDRPGLPLVAGDGARRATEEAMALFAAAAPIADRVRGLVRMGERRWDMVLQGGQRIQLPADGALQALDRVIALHEAQGMLDLDIVTIDMRRKDRPTVRMSAYAAETVRRLAMERLAE